MCIRDSIIIVKTLSGKIHSLYLIKRIITFNNTVTGILSNSLERSSPVFPSVKVALKYVPQSSAEHLSYPLSGVHIDDGKFLEDI